MRNEIVGDVAVVVALSAVVVADLWPRRGRNWVRQS